MNISLLNVPPETPDHLLTDYLNSYADIQGTPLHVKKSHDGIDYSLEHEYIKLPGSTNTYPDNRPCLVESSFAFTMSNQKRKQDKLTVRDTK